MTAQDLKPILNPTLQLLVSSPINPIPDDTRLKERLAALDPSCQPTDIQMAWQQRNPHQIAGTLNYGKHLIQIASFSTPLSSTVIHQSVSPSPWQPQVKAAMRHHRAHLDLVYQGNHHDPIERMIALYQVAHVFENENLLGIANPQAWTAHPPADFLSEEKISSFRQEFPFMLWIGYVKFFVDKERYWFTTKGHHIFDVPDLAYFVKSEEDLPGIKNIFANIFYYLYEKDVVVTVGDTLEIKGGKQNLQFAKIPEDTDYLMGPSGTLAIELISHEDNAIED